MTMLPVDGVEIRVVVDNVTDGLSSNPSHVDNEFRQLTQRGVPVVPESLCCAVHGLSLLLTARRGEQKHTVLFDTGPEEYAFERNVTRLGAPLASVDAIVLSHGHWDHCGGVISALNLARRGSDHEIPVYVHPRMFDTRAIRLADGRIRPMKDVASVRELETHGARVVSAEEPQMLIDGMFYVSGEIPRVTDFERGLPGQVRKVAEGQWEPDELLPDERWLGVYVAGKGMIVVSGCSHAGIINVLEDCRTRFPNIPIHAVIGGLHLAGVNEQVIKPTVEAMRAHDLRSINTAHCTGWRAVGALADAFGDDVVVPAAVGKRYNY